MKKRLFAIAVLSAFISFACGDKKNPTSPSSPTPTTTRIIALEGNMAFGNISLGSSFSATLRVYNQGNAPLTITGCTGTNNINTVARTAGASATIQPGGSQAITVTFTPLAVQSYSGTITVNGDQTSGINTIAFSGAGTLEGLPIFTRSGEGDTVFDMPTHVRRVRIVGTFAGNSSNFIVHIGGQHLVNELLGTFWGPTTYDGILATTGGVVEITSSSGVSWSFTEVR